MYSMDEASLSGFFNKIRPKGRVRHRSLHAEINATRESHPPIRTSTRKIEGLLVTSSPLPNNMPNMKDRIQLGKPQREVHSSPRYLFVLRLED